MELTFHIDDEIRHLVVKHFGYGCWASVGLDELLFLEFAWLRFLEFAWLRPFTLNGKRGRRRISLGFTN